MARLLSLAILGAALSSAGAGQPLPDYKTTVKDLVDGSVRGVTLPAFVEEQHQKGLATWKRVFLGKGPGHHESARLLLYGSVPNRTLKEVGAALEKQYALAAKALDMEQDEPWPGKLAVFFMSDRSQYVSFIRVVEQRRIEDGEAGSFHVDMEAPYVVAGPPQLKVDPPLEGQAGEQLAGALLSRKGGAKVPSWVLSAFGRATVLRAGPPTALAAEHRKAAQYLGKKFALRDVVGAGLGDDESTILRASVLEYLAYSGRTSKFLAFVQGFRPTDAVPEPTFETALTSANLMFDRLDQVWQAWVRAGK